MRPGPEPRSLQHSGPRDGSRAPLCAPHDEGNQQGRRGRRTSRSRPSLRRAGRASSRLAACVADARGRRPRRARRTGMRSPGRRPPRQGCSADTNLVASPTPLAVLRNLGPRSHRAVRWFRGGAHHGGRGRTPAPSECRYGAHGAAGGRPCCWMQAWFVFLAQGAVRS